VVEETIIDEFSLFGRNLIKTALFWLINVIFMLLSLSSNYTRIKYIVIAPIVIFPYIPLAAISNVIMNIYFYKSRENLMCIFEIQSNPYLKNILIYQKKTIIYKIYSFFLFWVPFLLLLMIYPLGSAVDILNPSISIPFVSLLGIILVGFIFCIKRSKFENKVWISFQNLIFSNFIDFPDKIEKEVKSGITFLKTGIILPSSVIILALSAFFQPFILIPVTVLPFLSIMGYFQLGNAIRKFENLEIKIAAHS
jgi:hypothetical protein